eukprot:1737883-Rhodomonas_salina.1
MKEASEEQGRMLRAARKDGARCDIFQCPRLTSRVCCLRVTGVDIRHAMFGTDAYPAQCAGMTENMLLVEKPSSCGGSRQLLSGSLVLSAGLSVYLPRSAPTLAMVG